MTDNYNFISAFQITLWLTIISLSVSLSEIEFRIYIYTVIITFFACMGIKTHYKLIIIIVICLKNFGQN